MVAYKTDPLGLNDTVTPSSSNGASASHNKRSIRHLANRLTVKKNKGRGASTTTTTTATTRSSEQQAVISDSIPPSTDFEDSKLPPVIVAKNDSFIIANPAAGPEESETMEPMVATMKDTPTVTAITTLGQPEQDQDNDETATTRRVKIPKFLQRFSRCCPRHDEIAANEKVLMTVFASFFMFTVSQLVLAFAANSLSLLGDTAAQIVDCIDYSINFVAERRKLRFDQLYQDPSPNLSPERALQLRERAKRKAMLFWEVVPPVISVICLIGVTTYVLQDSIQTLIQDFTTKPKAEQDDVNLTLVLTLQLVNLAIDILNFTCFAKIHHLRGFETVHQPRLTSTAAATNKDDAMEGGLLLKEKADAQVVAQEPPCTKSCCAGRVVARDPSCTKACCAGKVVARDPSCTKACCAAPFVARDPQCTKSCCAVPVVARDPQCTKDCCAAPMVARDPLCTKSCCAGKVAAKEPPCTKACCAGKVVARDPSCTKACCAGKVVARDPSCTKACCAVPVVARDPSCTKDCCAAPIVARDPSCTKGCCAVDSIVKNETMKNDNNSVVPTGAAKIKSGATSQPDCCADHHDHANLNMCSAYTHVLADSLRTISILTAVILALLIEPITAEAADSTAAVAVSFIILMTIVPLIRGLVAAYRELCQIEAEEKAERSGMSYYP